MIPLSVKVELTNNSSPFVLRLNSDWKPDLGPFDGYLKAREPNKLIYQSSYGDLQIENMTIEELDGDILLVVPERKIARRLIRAASPHNTLLITEQCDQLCVMCSQPPKKYHVDLFPYYECAVLLAPEGAIIGISGGEPTLYKEQLLNLISRSLSLRPDLSFHVLSNGQHFEDQDTKRLSDFPGGNVLWGIPLYSSSASIHDEIVKKDGAFLRLEESMSILYRAGASIELRTVIIQANAKELIDIASYVAARLPFVYRWAIMQLERIGYGRQNWTSLFYDNSAAFGPVSDALDFATARGIPTQLYNFPLCTVPLAYRHLAPSTISDWKRRYLSTCKGCSAMDSCGGFFEWYDESQGFENLVLQ
jgi:His-Xaa-Ser system radical SAM maturase HxsC